MSKIATLKDNNGTVKIKYEQLSINPQKIRFLNINELPLRSFDLNDIALKDEHEQIIGKQDASKIFTIDNKDDNARLKDALAKFGIPLMGVQLGGKRKRKTRKSKRPRKSKKSKRKTNRKKI